MGAARKRLSIMALPVSSIRDLERQLGTPVDDWQGLPKATLFPAILAHVDGGKPADYDDLTLADLIDRVTFGEPAPEPEAGQG